MSKHMLPFALISITISSYHTTLFARDFALIDSDCLMTGVKNGETKVETHKGAIGMSECKSSKDKLVCIWSATGSKDKSETIYEIAFEDKEYIVGRSKSGNISLFISFKEKQFKYGQVNMLESLALVSKICAGSVYSK